MYKRQFYNLDHAARYLTGCVVMVKGAPVIVREVAPNDRSYTILYRPLGKRDGDGVIDISSSDVDFSPPKLGFVNFRSWNEQRSYKTFRNPARVWKVGLYDRTLRIEGLSGTGIDDPSSIFNSVAMANTIQGKFPSYNKAVERATSNKDFSTAFSRRFCFDGTGNLHSLYHRKPIGKLKGNNGGVELHDDYRFMSEMLSEDM
jgi:hypothetical protein